MAHNWTDKFERLLDGLWFNVLASTRDQDFFDPPRDRQVVVFDQLSFVTCVEVTFPVKDFPGRLLAV